MRFEKGHYSQNTILNLLKNRQSMFRKLYQGISGGNTCLPHELLIT